MVAIKKEDRDYADSLIREIHTLFSNGGLSGESITRYSRLSYILTGLVHIRGYDDYSKEKQQYVDSLLWQHDKVVDLDSFRQIAIDNSKIKGKPTKTEVLFRFHIDENDLKVILESTSFGKEIRIVAKEEYRKIFDSSHNFKTQIKYDDYLEPYTSEGLWCIGQSYGPSHYAALSQAISEVELLRALINLKLTSNVMHYQTQPMQISSISPSKYFFGLVNNEIGLFWKISIGQHKKEDRKIESGNLNLVIETINNFHSLRRCSLVNDVTTCLYIFQEALDNYQRDYTFILLWSIIDILIPDIKNNDVLIRSIYKDIDREIDEILNILHNKRNLFVHQGKYTIFDLLDVNYLKHTIEDLFYFCFKASEKLNNTHELSLMLKKIRDKENTKREKEIIDYLVEKSMV